MSVMTHSILTANPKPTRYLKQMHKREASAYEWSTNVDLLMRAAQRWAHDEDVVEWVRRTLCEIGA